MRPSFTGILFVVAAFGLLSAGCDQQTASAPEPTPTVEAEDERVPPQPPMLETFDARPQLSLFPRVGDYQPADDDERYPFWKTFIDHFSKVSGLVKDPETENKAWSFRGINTIDSVAFFSPLAVEPATEYLISYRVKTELPEGAATGIGVLEFKEFLWIGEQYTEKTTREHLLGSFKGIELTGNIDWEEKEFTFRSSPQTKMIHIVFYREGEHSRLPVLIDDIEIVRTGER